MAIMSKPLPAKKAQPTATTTATTTALPTNNPIQIMDWESKLAKGDTSAQTRTVQDNERVAHQLNQLTASDSQYIQQARDRAMNEASSRGMMMSTMAAGASQRSAIDAALPIAAQDAETYLTTARDNMSAVNADRLADQGMFGQLVGQEVGIRANLDEAERGRGFTARENQLGREHQSSESALGRQHQSYENQLGRDWQAGENNMQREHQAAMQSNTEAWQAAQNALEREFKGTQYDKELQQKRFEVYERAMLQHNVNLTNNLQAIYSNPNLSAAEQHRAAENARAVHRSLANSYASAMAGGVPTIFWDPYEMPPGPPPNTSPPGGTPRPPVNPPVAPPEYRPRPISGGGGGGSGGMRGTGVGRMMRR